MFDRDFDSLSRFCLDLNVKTDERCDEKKESKICDIRFKNYFILSRTV